MLAVLFFSPLFPPSQNQIPHEPSDILRVRFAVHRQKNPESSLIQPFNSGDKPMKMKMPDANSANTILLAIIAAMLILIASTQIHTYMHVQTEMSGIFYRVNRITGSVQWYRGHCQHMDPQQVKDGDVLTDGQVNALATGKTWYGKTVWQWEDIHPHGK
jgi:hypothetical protein